MKDVSTSVNDGVRSLFGAIENIGVLRSTVFGAAKLGIKAKIICEGIATILNVIPWCLTPWLNSIKLN